MIATIIKRTILALAVMTVSLPGLAENTSSNTQANGSAILKLHSKDPLTKRIPSGLSLDVVYEDGILAISSNYYKGEFSLCFENYETGATTEIPSIHVGECVPVILEIGEYQLTAVAEDGTELIGFMQIY